MLTRTFLRNIPQFISLVAGVLLMAGCAAISNAQPDEAIQRTCSYDRTRLLSLNEQDFDQSKSGWRAVIRDKDRCYLEAAKLISEYRVFHNSESHLLFFHEAQLLALSGDYRAAIPLFKRAIRPDDQDEFWNSYVAGTVAFLSRDRTALDRILDKFHRAQLVDGVRIEAKEFPTPDGKVIKVPVPLNVDVLEGLKKCFDKPYKEAYSAACRQ